MSYKKLNIKNYREYLNDLQKDLDILDIDEQEVYEFIEDSYNAIENDNNALHKSFVKIFNHMYWNLEKKMFASMMLLLCHQKTQFTRQLIEDKKIPNNFKNLSRYEDEDEYINYDDDEGEEN